MTCSMELSVQSVSQKSDPPRHHSKNFLQPHGKWCWKSGPQFNCKDCKYIRRLTEGLSKSPLLNQMP